MFSFDSQPLRFAHHQQAKPSCDSKNVSGELRIVQTAHLLKRAKLGVATCWARQEGANCFYSNNFAPGPFTKLIASGALRGALPLSASEHNLDAQARPNCHTQVTGHVTSPRHLRSTLQVPGTRLFSIPRVARGEFPFGALSRTRSDASFAQRGLPMIEARG